eukprot:CAMPEP_0185173934 /NCGR_PEP_ID=MMETSP1139-20130426/24332_1 /TAXON_ID=298111 /ORGANISM="Pavlova sp., Strain CCMP459" /LENGTH=74 /DNA_ID=CAMNT_0027739641 /DNA_START=27 /DNA_END=247 /DNA_ORIENTATION=-
MATVEAMGFERVAARRAARRLRTNDASALIDYLLAHPLGAPPGEVDADDGAEDEAVIAREEAPAAIAAPASAAG